MSFNKNKMINEISFKQLILALVLNNIIWLFLFCFNLSKISQSNNIDLMNKLFTQQQAKIESLEAMIKLLSNKPIELVAVGWTLPVLPSEWYGFLLQVTVFTIAGIVCVKYVYSWIPVLQFNLNTISQHTGLDYLFNTVFSSRVVRSFNYSDDMTNLFTFQFSSDMQVTNVLIKPYNSLVTSIIDEFFRTHPEFFIDPIIHQAATITLDIVVANPETTAVVVNGINAIWGT